MYRRAPLLALLLLLVPLSATAQIDARLLRQPDVSETQITFVYGNDVWVVDKEGGVARKLSSPEGEEQFPRFSPDGQTIAFSGNYDGNTDVYTIPAGGGVPTRVTHHPEADRMVDWYPSGDSLFFATDRTSGRERYSQLYGTSPDGGLAQKLPVAYGEFGDLGPDGTTLAFTPTSRVFRTWKRYRGGMAADIWLFDLEDGTETRVTDHPANDEMPMWAGDTLYFLSDRGPNQRYNIWAYDTQSQETRQVTEFADYDVHFPAIGPSDLVFEAGDYVLAVNGVPLESDQAPWAALEGHAGETVELTVHDEPTREGARTVLVETMRSDDRLRYLDWIDQKRRRVAEATDGRVGYVYVPNTSIGGQTELVRQFRAQFEKDALIIDERFNSGGQIPDRFVELLNRPAKAFYAVRDGSDWQWPPVAHFGPQTMLINGWSGSGGDAFPTFFDRADRGPLIGTRTWGGLIGITGAPTLVDGGGVTVPTFRQYGPDGEWFPEGRGVTPDIRVENTPAPLARGEDPQLRRAIQEMTQALEDYTPVQPERPPYEDRTPSGSNE